ncbi:MAG: acetyl-CoA carboxylase biotin carboxyl carrier protein [Vulcanibacillus sp.]
MLKISEIKEIIDLIDQSNIKEIELEHEGTKLKLKKSVDHVQESNSIERNNNHVVSQSVRAEENNLFQIKSPMVGTFYKATAPGKAPYVKVGDKINVDTVVCIVEAMKLFNEIKAEVNGEIVEILAEEGQLIEYGQPLFLVK